MRCGQLRRIWLYAMGHCAERSRIVKICNDFRAMAIAQDLVVRYGPYRSIWLCAMDHCVGFGKALWAVAQNLAVRYVP